MAPLTLYTVRHRFTPAASFFFDSVEKTGGPEKVRPLFVSYRLNNAGIEFTEDLRRSSIPQD